MNKWISGFRVFLKNKLYVALLVLVAACGYGFKILHPVIGIDDTPSLYYFEEGLAAIVGRWVLFLLNKVVSVAEFAPFLTDLVAVILLVIAVTVWAVLFRSIFQDRIPWYGYWFWAVIFLSCPLISEVFTYYLHNGIAIGYLACGISLCCYREGLLRMNVPGRKCVGRDAVKAFLVAAALLWIALGCYESFMVVWLLGVFLILLSERFVGIKRSVFGALFAAGLVAMAGMVLRSLMIGAVTKLFGLEYLKDQAVQRSITEMAGWLFEEGAGAELVMMLKRIYVMYGVFGVVYYPITVFVGAAVLVALYTLFSFLKRRDWWIPLLALGSVAVSFVLVVIEGKATLYRSAQFVPVWCGFGALIACLMLRKGLMYGDDERSRETPVRCYHKWLTVVLVAAGSCVVWNQCADLNHWFYIDYNKYEYARETADRVAYELEKSFDISKPVIFTGNYDIPQSIVQDAYVEYNSDDHYKMQSLTYWLDPTILEKFNRTYGIWVAQTPSLSVIDWGRYAFGNDEELVRFFAMHGHTVQPLLDREEYEYAEEYSLDLPEFPAEGSIVDRGDYIIVHF